VLPPLTIVRDMLVKIICRPGSEYKQQSLQPSSDRAFQAVQGIRVFIFHMVRAAMKQFVRYSKVDGVRRSRRLVLGTGQNYYIHNNYTIRKNPIAFDDRSFTDQWQKEVYEFTRHVCVEENLQTIIDIGCGSGYKLIHQLGNYRTLGIEIEPYYSWLLHRYPKRECMYGDWSPVPFQPDLVISADVIEHLAHPDQLLAYVASLTPRYVVLSTPERDSLKVGTKNGPPVELRARARVEFCGVRSLRPRVLSYRGAVRRGLPNRFLHAETLKALVV